MEKRFQWKVAVLISAPVAAVWEAVEDLSLIPRYHPEVRSVEFLSGTTRRAPGVEYKCIIPEGRKGWCVEKVVEHVPLRKMSLAFGEDSWGLSEKVEDFLTELSLEKEGDARTRLCLEAFYVPKGIVIRCVNVLILRRMMRRRALATLDGLKRLIETSQGSSAEPKS